MKIKLPKLSKKIKISIAIALFLAIISTTYYLFVFLPQKQKRLNEQQKQEQLAKEQEQAKYEEQQKQIDDLKSQLEQANYVNKSDDGQESEDSYVEPVKVQNNIAPTSQVDAEKQKRQEKADEITSKLKSAQKKLAKEISEIEEEIEDINDDIEKTYKRSGISLLVMERAVAALNLQLANLQKEISPLYEKDQKISSIYNSLNSYVNSGMPLSASEIALLSSLKIKF